MKLYVVSDLHLEFSDFDVPPVDADAVVLAGDIWFGAHGLQWAASKFRPDRIVTVLGNHEFYNKGEYHEVIATAQAEAAALGIHLLHDSSTVIDGVRFLGGILWSDFRLYGDGPRQDMAMMHADAEISDFRQIKVNDPRTGWQRFKPRTAHALNRVTVDYLDAALAEPFDGPTVVVTHFLPSERSIAPKYKGGHLNPYFASNLETLIERHQPALWIHGHTHESCDYGVGGTRVVCNPRGYVPAEPNPDFSPALVIELE